VNVTLVVDALGPQLGGIGRYTLELCRRIPAQPEVERVGFFVNGHFIDDPESLVSGAGSRPRRRLPPWLRRRLDSRRIRSSLVHGPNYFLPPQAESGVITVHDLSVFRYPETHPPERLKAFDRDFRRSLERAVHVITDSETVRRELISDLGVDESRVSAIHLGVDERYRPRADAELRSQLSELGLAPGGYGLCVSTIEPRKKIAELVRAWRDLPRKLRDSTPLVLAGGQGWLNESVHREIREGVDAGWLHNLGFVPEAMLPALYSGAALFAYPSIYEGFGLPPVEAMASGVPVLVANRSCLPEVCGSAAAYCDPEDSEAFGNSIVEALTDTSWRTAARAQGPPVAAKYSWDKCALRTAEIYSRYAN
jgi:alpha-1,3-rhamnosyl/mannosyltransferase